MQAHPWPFQDVLAKGRGLATNDGAVLPGEGGVEARGQSDRHRQRRGWRTRRTVTHAHPDRSIRDPESWNPQFIDSSHVPFYLDLSGELVHVCSRLRGLGTDRVDVDGLHGAMQLRDLLV